MLSKLLQRAHKPATDLLVRERPPLPVAPDVLEPAERDSPDLMAEYAQLSKSLGVTNPHIDADLRIERFKAFLRSKDWAVFSLPSVTAYMDKKAEEESDAKAGWHWRPLRSQDDIRDVAFGQAARAWHTGSGVERSAASDHYRGPTRARDVHWNGNARELKEQEQPASSSPYDKLVPLHALRKVAAIEAEYPEAVSFFVCDYALAPHIEHPDPFLMAAINNARLNQGVGRFVIDFWDEPGFGLEQQIAG